MSAGLVSRLAQGVVDCSHAWLETATALYSLLSKRKRETNIHVHRYPQPPSTTG
jgi:hypothetical protein